ncbi:hypothetical protein MKW92_040761 [Papaver armeniacum]|nr:hypothetical protein MKW92_040761 [Papaver armeniacum]
MVISSNRSPSPISSSKTNLNNPRTPVSNNNLRKSFSGNPLNNPSFVRNSKNFNPTTPANTPTEFSQRSSLLNEYKENEKDPNLKPVKIRSSSPITKHFMAPTISTVSKIAAPSPRKKILGERNEPVRVSDDRKLSFAEKIQSCSDSVSCSQVLPPKVSSIENLSFTEIFESDLGLASKTLESSISDPIENPIFEIKESLHSSVTGENQLKPDENSAVSCLMEENPSKNPVPELVKPSCSSPVPVLAPLDLDPSLPPYDPKTNILSPRPLFLCYKPNPRVEAYRTKGTKLDDIFTTSESCSDDTKNTEETEYSVESEDVALSEEVVSEAVVEQMQEKNENIVCKKMSRQRTFVRTKIIPSLLVFVVACLCFTVTDSPVYNDDSSFEFGTSAMEMSPIDIVYNWVEMSASYLSMLNFMPKGVDTMIPFNVANLTMVNNEYRTRGYGENAIEEMQGMNGLGSQEEMETNEEVNQEEESFLAVETDDKSEDLADLDPGMIKESVAIHEKDGIEIRQHKAESVSSQSSEVVDAEEKSEAKMTEEEVNQEEVVGTDDSENLADHDPEMINESVAIHEQDGIALPQQHKAESFSSQSSEVVDAEEKSEAKLTEESCLLAARVEEKMEEFSELEPEMKEESVEFQEKDGNDIQRDTDAADLKLTQHASESDSSQSSEIDEASPHDLSLGTPESVIHDLADKSLKQTVMQISLVLLTLISGAAFLYMRSKKASTLEPVETLQPKKLVSSSTSTSNDSKRPQIERFCSQNWEIEEEMVAGHSGPSGMSSDFQNSSSCKDRESERENEVQSSRGRPISRNLDVESSSNYSAGSVSYGSFTTHEKLHNKHGYGEEVVTPVRRSNRIRKKQHIRE